MVTPEENDAVKIIDFGAHCHPDDPPENEFFHSFIDNELGKPIYKDIDAYERHYEACGLDGAVLSQPYYMGHSDVGRAQTANDVLLDEIRDRPNYFGLVAIPTAAGGEEAAAEFERCLDAGFHGGSLETKSAGVELHHREAEPILEVADRTGAPILVHPKLIDSLHPDALDDAWLLNAIFGREAALSESICKVIHTGVLDRYPSLNLVYHHTGGNISSMLGRFHNQFEKFPPDIWIEAVPDQEPEPFKRFPAFKRQLEKRIYVDTAGYYGYPTVLRSALTELPASQLLFGTDFPFETRNRSDFEEMMAPIQTEVSMSDSARIFSGNALNLLINVP